MFKTAHYMLTRELAFLLKRKFSRAFFMCVYPFIIMGVLIVIFSGEILNKIPVAVNDNSQGVHAREVVRGLSSNQYLKTEEFPTISAALKALNQGRVYAVVSIDKNFDKDISKHTGAQISTWVNNEYLLIGGNVTKGINNVILTLNNTQQRKILAALGVPDSMWETLSAPLQISEVILHNPSLNYIYFLGLGLLPAIFQLFICLSVCYSLLWDIKTRRAKYMRHTFTEHPYIAAGSKIGFYIFSYSLIMLFMLAILIIFFKLPVNGSLLLTALGVMAFAFLTASTALLIAAITNNLRLGMSCCAAYAAPAFAYYGVSFPVQSMPILAQIWAQFMPGTHLNLIFVNELLRGANTAGTYYQIAFMLMLGTLFFCVGTKGYAHWTKQDKYLGPKL